MKQTINSKSRLLFCFLFLGILSSYAQQTITGIVTDGDFALPGADVYVKGTTKGTTTDFDGNYTLEDVPTVTSLVK